MQSEELQDKIFKAVHARQDELIALTQDLIRIPTLNPPGENYREICEYIGERLKKRGFEIEYIRAEGSPGDCENYPRWNVIAHKSGKHKGECVHFNSHIDVVDIGEAWTYDPFGGALVDGKIYGRGACDMKGGLAASMIAAELFTELFPDFSGAIEISATADEESGGYGGVAYLAERGYFNPDRVQHVIIPEPLNKDRICLGHRGVWWAEIETHGRIAHGSMPFLGDCAVRHMGAVLEKFESDLFPKLADRKTKMQVVPEGARRSTMNINSIHGGQAESLGDARPSPIVPDRCRMVIDRRFLAEEALDDVKGEVEAVLDDLRQNRPNFCCHLRELLSVLPSKTDMDAPIVKTLSHAIEEVLQKKPEYVISPGTYDQKHIDRIGKLKNCVAYGPGILDLAHQPDEYIGVEDMVDSIKIMILSLKALLLPENAS